MFRWLVGGLLLLLACLGIGYGVYQSSWFDVGPGNAIVLIIMDTVRADHTSLCGYSRPTTPNLERFAKEGAVFTCEARAPGSWTLPSHASYFTGKQALDHRAHELPTHRGEDGGKAVRGTAAAVRPLKKTKTLASILKKEGYQTVLLAENPVISKATGLTQGYRTIHLAKTIHELKGDAAAVYLQEKILSKLRHRDGPLFLTVNLTDAHSGWPGVPEEAEWLPTRSRFELEERKPDGFWYRYWNNLIPPEELQKKMAHIVDNYDYGVWREDQAVGKILENLKKDQWCGVGCRIVIVSDHGELSGEHGMIQHGWNPWEQNARVPLMVIGSELTSLPSPINALHTFHLAKDGKLPTELTPIEQPYWPHADRAKITGGKYFTHTGLIHWSGVFKTIWEDGQVRRYDLSRDPMEEQPEILPELPAEMSERVNTVLAEKGDLAWQPGLEESLKALGYLE